MTTKQLSELKNLIKMAYDGINNMVSDFQDTEAHAYLLSAQDLAAEIVVANKAKLKVCYLISIAAIELRNLIEYAYNDINNMVSDFQDTEAHAYLLSALDMVDELE